MPFLSLGPSHRYVVSHLKSITYDKILGLLADIGTPGVLLNMDLLDDSWSDNAYVQEWKWEYSAAL